MLSLVKSPLLIVLMPKSSEKSHLQFQNKLSWCVTVCSNTHHKIQMQQTKVCDNFP